jgi:hypothetical protein
MSRSYEEGFTEGFEEGKLKGFGEHFEEARARVPARPKTFLYLH